MILYVVCVCVNRSLEQLEVETGRRVERCEAHAGSLKGRQVAYPEHDLDRWRVLKELLDHPSDIWLVLSGLRGARSIEALNLDLKSEDGNKTLKLIALLQIHVNALRCA